MLISLVGFTLLYGALAVVEVWLFARVAATGGPEPAPKPASPASPTTRPRLWPTDGADSMDLQTLWFVLIAVLWTGYFVLEGFDFGVGMLLCVVGRTSPSGGR